MDLEDSLIDSMVHERKGSMATRYIDLSIGIDGSRNQLGSVPSYHTAYWRFAYTTVERRNWAQTQKRTIQLLCHHLNGLKFLAGVDMGSSWSSTARPFWALAENEEWVSKGETKNFAGLQQSIYLKECNGILGYQVLFNRHLSARVNEPTIYL